MAAAQEPRRTFGRAREGGKPTPVELLRTAYEEGRQAVALQRDELSGIRQRAVQYMAFVGSATGFLVGSALLGSGERESSFYAVAAFATAASAVTLLLLAFVLLSFVKHQPDEQNNVRWGIAEWNFTVEPKVLVEGWINPHIGGADEGEFYEDLALHYGDKAEDNEVYIKQIQKWYASFVIAGGLQLVLWVSAVWAFA